MAGRMFAQHLTERRQQQRTERRTGGATVYRTKRRFVEGNLERALSEEPRPGAERKLTGKKEALLWRPVPVRWRAVSAGRSSCWQVRRMRCGAS